MHWVIGCEFLGDWLREVLRSFGILVVLELQSAPSNMEAQRRAQDDFPFGVHPDFRLHDRWKGGTLPPMNLDFFSRGSWLDHFPFTKTGSLSGSNW